MASTFAEIFSDFQDQVKIYVEKLDLTELGFMRYLTKGIQVFQRETELIEKSLTITYDTTRQCFFVPDDMIRPVELKDEDGFTMLPQEYTQFTRNLELWADGHLDTPTTYTRRMESYRNGNLTRLYAIWDRVIKLYPEARYDGNADTILYMWYIPDCHPISQNSIQWNYNDALGNPAGWYPIDVRFDTMFRNAQLNHPLAVYEEAFLNYAIAMFIRSQGSANYKVFEQTFWEEVRRAKENKPVMFTEGVRQYLMAPFN